LKPLFYPCLYLPLVLCFATISHAQNEAPLIPQTTNQDTDQTASFFQIKSNAELGIGDDFNLADHAPKPALKARFEAMLIPINIGPISYNIPVGKRSVLKPDQLHYPFHPQGGLQYRGFGAHDNSGFELGYNQPWPQGQLSLSTHIDPYNDGKHLSLDHPLSGQLESQSVAFGSKLEFNHAPNDRLSLNASASLAQELTDQVNLQNPQNPTIMDIDQQTIVQNIQGHANWQADRNINVNLSMDHSLQEHFSSSLINQQNEVQALISPTNLVETYTENFALATDIKANERVHVYGGVSLINTGMSQSNRDGPTNERSRSLAYTKPQLALDYNTHSPLTLSLKLEGDMTPLGFQDLLSANNSVTQPRLNPSIRVTEAAKLNYNLPLKGQLSLTLEQTHIQNVIETVETSGSNPMEMKANIGSGESADLATNLSFKTDELQLKGGQVDMKTVLATSSVTDPQTGQLRPLSGQTPITVNINFTQTIKNTGLAWGMSANNGWLNTVWRPREIDISQSSPEVNLFAVMNSINGIAIRADVSHLTGRTLKYSQVRFSSDRTLGDTGQTYTNSQDLSPAIVITLQHSL